MSLAVKDDANPRLSNHGKNLDTIDLNIEPTIDDVGKESFLFNNSGSQSQDQIDGNASNSHSHVIRYYLYLKNKARTEILNSS